MERIGLFLPCLGTVISALIAAMVISAVRNREKIAFLYALWLVAATATAVLWSLFLVEEETAVFVQFFSITLIGNWLLVLVSPYALTIPNEMLGGFTWTGMRRLRTALSAVIPSALMVLLAILELVSFLGKLPH